MGGHRAALLPGVAGYESSVDSNLCREVAFHFVRAGTSDSPKPKSFSLPLADNGRELMLLPIVRLAHEHDEFAPINGNCAK